jgi:putative mRNA 3-end processing factor
MCSASGPKRKNLTALVTSTDAGLYCERGDFYIDPWAPVGRALVTHGHGDHARQGNGAYLCAQPSLGILRRRLGPDAVIESVRYGQTLSIGGVRVSFHPAGHVLGSAQIRVESADEICVVSGDYKRVVDPTCAPYEIVTCDTFVTEATFALPVFRWHEPSKIAHEIYDWWMENRAGGRASVLFCYALGKAQRILAALRAFAAPPILLHGALAGFVALYREAGVELGPTRLVSESEGHQSFRGELILAPLSARGTIWMRRFGDHSSAFASGWMRIRGARRRRGYERGFVLSDHADWPALLQTIADTGARHVWITHGFTDVLARYLNDRGIAAGVWRTAFEGEADVETG